MEIINLKKTGDLVINADTQYNNILAENVTVNEGITTRLYGIIKKDLIAEKEATVYLHGKVLGKIINKGGVIYLFAPSGTIETF